MKAFSLLLLLWVGCAAAPRPAVAQLYFPPLNSTAWDTTSALAADLDSTAFDSLKTWLEAVNTKAFLVLHRGKIVIEWYLNAHDTTTPWPWNSAGKALTATLVGKAQEQGYLSVSDTTSQYLGPGWTSLPDSQERAIQLIHQLTMTTGLDDGVANANCTDDTCLLRLAAPETRWAYHNAPYSLLYAVIDSATGTPTNTYLDTALLAPIGMEGRFTTLGYSHIFRSTARSMARFGLLIQAGGTWDGTPVLTDTAYVSAMTRPSQALNPSYGYLWWLNGQSSYQVPGIQFNFPGAFAQTAPSDLFAGIGKDAQIVAVVPSQELVLVRMGDDPGDGSPAPLSFIDSLWKRIVYLDDPVAQANPSAAPTWQLYPNPATETVHLHLPGADASTRQLPIQVYAADGRLVRQLTASDGLVSVADWPAGLYTLRITPPTGPALQARLVKR